MCYTFISMVARFYGQAQKRVTQEITNKRSLYMKYKYLIQFAVAGILASNGYAAQAACNSSSTQVKILNQDQLTTVMVILANQDAIGKALKNANITIDRGTYFSNGSDTISDDGLTEVYSFAMEQGGAVSPCLTGGTGCGPLGTLTITRKSVPTPGGILVDSDVNFTLAR
jgi:hypothetical protein